MFPPRSTAPRPAPKAKLKPAEGLARFVAGATTALAKLGFATDARAKSTWTRSLPNGVVHQISLNLGTREPRPNVAVGDPELMTLLSRATGMDEPLPTMGLEYLYFRGLVPGQPWNERGRASFNYEICHAECVDKSVVTFAREVARFAVPLFEQLGTLASLDDFFHRTKPYGPARKNWEMDREAASGPAGHFWRADRGLLLVTAVAAVARPKARKATFTDARQRAKQWQRRHIYGASKSLLAELDTLEATLGPAPRARLKLT